MRIVYVNENGTDPDGNQKCETAGSVYVASAVVWTDSKCSNGSNCHRVVLGSCFANLNSLVP
jgi:hypothetical protein